MPALLRAKIEIEVSHSLSGTVPAAFGSGFDERSVESNRQVVSEESIRDLLHEIDGSIASSGVESGRSVVRIWNCLWGPKRKFRGLAAHYPRVVFGW